MANFAAAASLVLSVLALVVSMAIAARQLRVAHNSNAISVMLDLFGEYRSPEMHRARAVVLGELPSVQRDATRTGLASLPAETRQSALRVSHFFDNVGVLVANDLIPAEPLIAFFGVGAVNCWQRLLPYIAEERDSRAMPSYQGFFELFVELAKKRDPTSAMLRMKRRTLRRLRMDG